MQKVEINVIENILKNSMALHDFGKPVNEYIKRCCELVSPTLFVINLLGANPLDYEFVNVSFCDIINKYRSDLEIFVVFKAGKWEREELFTGLIDILKLKSQPETEEKNILIESGFSILLIDEKGLPFYLAPLTEKHKDVLNDIDKYTGISSSDIQRKFNLSVEDTSQILNDLVKYKFVYTKEGPSYHSIKSLI